MKTEDILKAIDEGNMGPILLVSVGLFIKVLQERIDEAEARAEKAEARAAELERKPLLSADVHETGIYSVRDSDGMRRIVRVFREDGSCSLLGYTLHHHGCFPYPVYTGGVSDGTRWTLLEAEEE